MSILCSVQKSSLQQSKKGKLIFLFLMDYFFDHCHFFVFFSRFDGRCSKIGSATCIDLVTRLSKITALSWTPACNAYLSPDSHFVFTKNVTCNSCFEAIAFLSYDCIMTNMHLIVYFGTSFMVVSPVTPIYCAASSNLRYP